MNLFSKFIQFLSSYLYGLSLPIRALLTILKNPSLIFWSTLPIILTLVLYIFIIQKLTGFTQQYLIHWIETMKLDPQGWASTIAFWFSHLILFLIAAITFSFIAAVVASPLNDFLAEKTEKFATPALPLVTETTFGQKVRLIWIDCAKSLAATFMSILALLLSWVPIINLFALILAFLLISFQYTSYPQTRRGLKLHQGLAFLGAHFFSCVGFGMSMMFLFSIPFAACFFVPLAVVGGTLLVSRAQESPQNQRLF